MAGLVSIGGKSSRSNSQSTSSQGSYGYSGSTSGGFSTSTGTSTSGQEVFAGDLYQQLFGSASSVAGTIAQDPFLSTVANDLYKTGANTLGALGEIDSDTSNQIGLLSEDIGRLFSEQLNPVIEGNAIAGGGLGGSRQGVAQGIAAGQAASEFRRGAADIYSRAQDRKLTAGQSILGGLQGVYDIAGQGALSGLAPYQALSGILGGPLALTQSQSSQDAVAANFAEAFGEDVSYGESQSTSSSKSKEFSLGFG